MFVFHTESFHLKNNPLCLTNEEVEVGGGGSCLFLKLGKNSMGSNSVSQWKMFRFLNVVWQTGRCPALAPQTTHTHLCTRFPPFPVGGWGWPPPLSNTCRTKTRWVHGCRPARVIPVCLGTERVPGPRFRPQRLGGPQRKEIGLRTSLVSVHLHVRQFSHTMEGWPNIPSPLGSYEMGINSVVNTGFPAWLAWC